MTATVELLERVTEAKQRLAGLVDENEQMLSVASAKAADDAEAKERGIVAIVTDEDRVKFRGNLDAIKAAREFIETAQATLDGREYLKAPQGDFATQIAAAIQGAGRKQGPLSIGELFVNSPEFKALKDGGIANVDMKPGMKVALADIASFGHGGRKDMYTGLPGVNDPSGPLANFGQIQRDPTIPLPQRRLRVRELFPVQGTDARVIQYFRVSGFTNNASPVPERTANNSGFAQKPHSNITFESDQATVRTIAHWEVAHRNVLDDEPQLRGIIDNELLYGLQLAEDAQILSGAGTGEDLPGILNDPGIQLYSQSAVGSQNKADAIRRAATLITLALFEPTGVVVNDHDWEDMELLKDNNGQYLLATSIAVGGEPRVWRLPVAVTPAIPDNKALVGAFGLAAQLYDRQEANIRTAEQHDTLFTANAILILAEERLALAIKRPEAFVEITFNSTGQ